VTGEGLRFGRWLIPEAELEERFDTYGGPGGQHANKSETAVTLRFPIEESSLPEEVRVKLVARLGPEVEVSASATRSQWQNRQIARDRLRGRLEAALTEPKPRRKTKPSKAAREQRLTEKKARGELKRSRQRPEGDD
jgi:ribosome-associated protein